MYTNIEISTMVNNCNTMQELYKMCSVFNYLIEEKFIKKSFFLELTTQLKFRELEKL